MKKAIFILLILCISLASATFTEDTSINIQGLMYSSQSWSDYNNDADQDLIICGQSLTLQSNGWPLASSVLTKIYSLHVSGSTVSETQENFSIVNVTYCSVNFADINNDGYDDIIIAGLNSTNNSILYTYLGNGINFTFNQNLTGISFGNTVYGDIDNDNDLDLVAIGCESLESFQRCTTPSVKVYLNTAGTFTESLSWESNLTPVWRGSIALADYTNDGKLDLALSGVTSNAPNSNTPEAITYLYKNNGSGFVIDTANSYGAIDGIYWGSIAFEDYDNDTDLDLFITGKNASGNRTTKVFENDESFYHINSQPTSPTITVSTVSSGIINLNWSQSSDTENLSGLYYSIRIGTSQYGNDIISGLYPRSSNPTQGYFGNLGQRNSLQLNNSVNNPSNKCLYWQVEAIDPGMLESDWSSVSTVSFAEASSCDSVDSDCNGYDLDDAESGSAECKDGIDNDCDGKIDCVSGNSDSGCACGSSGSGGGSPSVNQGAQNQLDTKKHIDDVSKNPPVEVAKPSEGTGSSTPPAIEKPAEIKTEDLIFDSMNLRVSVTGQIDGSSTIITNTISNKGIFDRNFQLKNKIPKEYASSADKIDSLGEDFQVIQYDPIIAYNLSLKPYKQTYVKYKLPIILDAESLSKIQTIIDEDKDDIEKQKQAFKDKLDQTSQLTNVTETYTQDRQNNKTTFTIKIDVNQTKGQLYNVSIFQEIPKCLVKIINEQMIEAENKNFEIINADPLIVWHFDSILDVEKIQFTISAIGDENCTNQVKALAVAKDIILYKKGKDEINYVNLWIAISLFPLIMLFLIIFGLLTNKIEHDDEEIYQMTEFIRHHYRQGYNKEDVRNKLISQGHPLILVDRCLHLHTQSKFQFLLHKFEIGTEELVLAVLIVFNYLEFTDRLSGDLNYLQKVLSILAMAYLFYKISPTKIILGSRQKMVDCMLIIAYTALTMKSLVNLAHTNIWQADFVLDLYTYIIYNNQLFESYLFLAGIALLVIAAFYLAIKIPIKAPSFLTALHAKEGKPLSIFGYLWRFVVIHLTLIAFYVIIFNLVLEWLAVVIDSFISTMIVIIMIFLLIKHWKRLTFGLFKKADDDDFTIAKWLEDASSASEKFYENFIDLFHYKKTIFLGISGMLILHIMTELGNFVVPYLIGLRVSGEDLYFAYLDRLPLFSLVGKSLFALQTAGLSLVIKLQVIFVYSLNIIGAIFIIIIPALIWLNFYNHRKLPILEVLKFKLTKYHVLNSLMFSLFSSSMFMLFTRPVFTLRPIAAGISATGLHELNLSGVDLVTNIISLNGISGILATTGIIAVLAFLLSYFFEKVINFISLPISLVFFSYYVYLFTTSIILTEASTNLSILFAKGSFIIAVYYGLFTLISILFLYLLGLLIVIYLYMHPKLKAILHEIPVLRIFFISHNLHHIHHYDTHDTIKHDTEEAAMKEYILKSIDSGHELFHVVEYLVEHKWPINLIEDAVHDATSDPRYKEEMKHIKHYHHNREKLQSLGIWIKQMYETHSLEQIIDAASSAKWTEDDIMIAFTSVKPQLHIRKEDNEIAKYMYITN